MEYIYNMGFALGGFWAGYLIGQFSSVKEMNRRLNALVAEKKSLTTTCENLTSDVNSLCEINSKLNRDMNSLMDECDRMADIIGNHQSKAHACDKCNQFASKRKAVTAELQAYVASKKAA